MEQKTQTMWVVAVVLIALALAVAVVYLTFFAPPRVAANLVLQANPTVTLALDERNIVVEARGLDAEGESLLAELDVAGGEVAEVLRVIADALRQAGLLEDGRRIQMAASGQLGEAELAALAGAAEQAIRGYLAEQGLAVDVVVVQLTPELAEAVRAAALLPTDYVGLVAEAGPTAALAVLGFQEELGLDPILFKGELSTIASALADMREAGIAEENALAILRGGLAADPSLEELTTITAATIDLHEVGATQESIMAVFGLVEERLGADVDRARLLEEFTTITAAKADMLEAGIPAAAALDTLRTAMQADPTMEELTTITAMMVDLVADKGLSKEEALTRIQSAIREDPTLQKFDELVEDEPQEQPERGPDRPQPPRLPAPPTNQVGVPDEEAEAVPAPAQRDEHQPARPPQNQVDVPLEPNGY
jgi:hypothetical protein